MSGEEGRTGVVRGKNYFTIPYSGGAIKSGDFVEKFAAFIES
jgi:hypothetical protein